MPTTSPSPRPVAFLLIAIGIWNLFYIPALINVVGVIVCGVIAAALLAKPPAPSS